MTYTIHRDGQQFGPYSREDVTRYLNEGRLLRSDLVWMAEQQRWAPLSELVDVPTPVSLLPTPDKAAVSAFVGKKYSYYETKWAALEIKKSVTSWNWAAFCWGPFWLAYRKMYLYAWGYMGLVVIDSICERVFHWDDKATSPVFWALSAVIALQGNYWYRLHVDKRVAEILAIPNPQTGQIELVRQGGTSIGSAILLAVALIVIAIGSTLPDILNKP